MDIFQVTKDWIKNRRDSPNYVRNDNDFELYRQIMNILTHNTKFLIRYLLVNTISKNNSEDEDFGLYDFLIEFKTFEWDVLEEAFEKGLSPNMVIDTKTINEVTSTYWTMPQLIEGEGKTIFDIVVYVIIMSKRYMTLSEAEKDIKVVVGFGGIVTPFITRSIIFLPTYSDVDPETWYAYGIFYSKLIDLLYPQRFDVFVLSEINWTQYIPMSEKEYFDTYDHYINRVDSDPYFSYFAALLFSSLFLRIQLYELKLIPVQYMGISPKPKLKRKTKSKTKTKYKPRRKKNRKK